MMPKPDLSVLPKIPCDDDGPVFAEPWQAHAFAMTVKLHEAGVFQWSEWAEALGAERAKASNDDDGSTYYLDWFSALEGLLSEKNVVSLDVLLDRKAAWSRATDATPHGQPILLGAELK